MKKVSLFVFFTIFSLIFTVSAQPNYDYTKLQREKLGRGIIAIRKDSSTVFVAWRYLSTDPVNVFFNVYRNGQKINKQPIFRSTCYKDLNYSLDRQSYEVRAVVNGTETKEIATTYVLPANAPIGYVNIPLSIPVSGISPDGQEYSYSSNDASVGDVDGDGEYEIILKWDPSNSHDNAHNGYTGNVYMDCYKLTGQKLWRIDLGRNIRAGAHYTQFMVYDLDGDNKAELVMKTADGTIDGKGHIIGNAKADYRTEKGRILSGPEFLTVFSGETGEALKTVDYKPLRGKIEDWGDANGNRMDRYLACIAYLDGVHPSVVMCRGYYTRTVLVAYDWKNGELTERWTFDSNNTGNADYAGQGNHNLRVGDIDGDGCDEIIYGACAIDNNGKGLYSTKMGHGDAIHMTAFDPSSRELQVWDCHENKRDGSSFRNAKTGNIIFQVKSIADVGRCMAADIDPNHKGVEMWSIDSGGIRNIKGEVVNPSIKGVPVNMACWWDGDLLRELLDGTKIVKYDYVNGGSKILFDAEECIKNNGTKSNPSLQADLCGDWREEVLLRTKDNANLRLYVSTFDTDYRFHSFMEDPIYRISVATENVAYNQPTQPGFYFGSDLGKCFSEKEIKTSEKSITLDAGMDYDSYKWSIGGAARKKVITTKDLPVNKRTKIELTVTFRGYQFKDYVYLTFQKAVK